LLGNNAESKYKENSVGSYFSIISGLQQVWRQASLREGFGPPATDWKLHYVTSVRLLQRLKKGRAFQHRNFAPKYLRCISVSDVALWNGYILAGEIIKLHPFYFCSPSSSSALLSLPV
jgi:hypothetical protein